MVLELWTSNLYIIFKKNPSSIRQRLLTIKQTATTFTRNILNKNCNQFCEISQLTEVGKELLSTMGSSKYSCSDKNKKTKPEIFSLCRRFSFKIFNIRILEYCIAVSSQYSIRAQLYSVFSEIDYVSFFRPIATYGHLT